MKIFMRQVTTRVAIKINKRCTLRRSDRTGVGIIVSASAPASAETLLPREYRNFRWCYGTKIHLAIVTFLSSLSFDPHHRIPPPPPYRFIIRVHIGESAYTLTHAWRMHVRGDFSATGDVVRLIVSFSFVFRAPDKSNLSTYFRLFSSVIL